MLGHHKRVEVVAEFLLFLIITMGVVYLRMEVVVLLALDYPFQFLCNKEEASPLRITAILFPMPVRSLELATVIFMLAVANREEEPTMVSRCIFKPV